MWKKILQIIMRRRFCRNTLKKKDKTTPNYLVLSESGPEHRKTFEVQLSYNDEVLAVEKGFSKKEAEQKCAYSACKKLGII